MKRNQFILFFIVSLMTIEQLPLMAADPWADNVNEYLPGEGISNDFVAGTPFNNANVALGAPTRFTSDVDNFGGATTPLQSAFRSNEIVSIGRGGSLTVSFNEPVINDPQNPFGIDLLIFGNSFLFGQTIFNDDFSFNPSGTVDGVANEGGIVEISDDGENYTLVPNLDADGLYPTYSYTDLLDPFPSVTGDIPTDFTRPVNPAFDVTGKTYAEVIAGYNGSGGGAGIDIGALGFESITHVRISNPMDSDFVPEIDALADVRALPEPSTLVLAAMMSVASLLGTRRRRIG